MANETLEKQKRPDLPWWKSWWTIAIIVTVVFILVNVLHLIYGRSTGLSLPVKVLILAIWLSLYTVFWFVWTSGERLTRKEKQQRAKERREECNLRRERFIVDDALRAFSILTGGIEPHEENIKKFLSLETYSLPSTYSFEKVKRIRLEDPNKLMINLKKEGIWLRGLPEVWIVVLRHLVMLDDGVNNEVRMILGLGWSREFFWRIRKNYGQYVLVDLRNNMIPFKEDWDIVELLTFVKKYHNVEELTLEYIAKYGVPVLEESKSGGKKVELKNLRVMLQLGPEIFKNGLNPDPNTLEDTRA